MSTTTIDDITALVGSALHHLSMARSYGDQSAAQRYWRDSHLLNVRAAISGLHRLGLTDLQGWSYSIDEAERLLIDLSAAIKTFTSRAGSRYLCAGEALAIASPKSKEVEHGYRV